LLFATGCLGRTDLESSPRDGGSTPITDAGPDVAPCTADTMNDPANCGACNNKCSTGSICKMGICTPCPAGFAVCANACADLGGDAKNCGMCGNACTGMQVCAAGLCSVACPIGRSKCGSNCVDVLKDPNNCGGCGIACKGGETCTSGVCCPSGQSLCNGACVDLTSDPKNCGTCGNVCEMGSCSGSKCVSCNKNVLVVADQSAATNDLVNALGNAGFTATTASVSSYGGMPAASSFGAVIITNGTQWSVDMPNAGQQAIANAQANGVGVVMTEWVAYEIEQNRYQALKPLLLVPRKNGVYTKLTFTSQVAHPIWTGLPASFTTTNSMGANVSSTLVGGATSIATCPQCQNIGVAVKDAMNQGRIVQIAHAASFMGGVQVWSNDANTTKMMTNSVGWAARCL
jgi:hypothetical protein